MPSTDRGPAFQSIPRPQKTRANKVLLLFLLFCACCFIGRSAVFENSPSIDPYLYTSGHEKMPYQGRLLMVPLIRLFLHSPILDHAPAHLGAVPAGLALVNTFCLAVMCFAATRIALLLGLHRSLYYLPSVATCITIAATYCIRQEWAVYSLYDFPAYMFFALGLLCLIAGRPAIFAAICLIGMLNRETIILLIPLAAAWALKDEPWTFDLLRKRPLVFLLSILFVALLFAERHIVVHLLGYDRSAIGYMAPLGLKNVRFLQPWHIPQVLSALGFSLPVVFYYRRFLPRPAWVLLMGLIPGLAVLAYSGFLIETRIWGEFAVLVSVLLCLEFQQYLALPGLHRKPDPAEGGHAV